jgi:hypothetical protein
MRRKLSIQGYLRDVPARLVGIFERAVLGTAMTIALAALERRLSRPRDRRKTGS